MRTLGPLLVSCALFAGCRPASVESVHQWLTAYGADDVEAMVAHTWPGDRELVAQAMADLSSNPTSTAAMALPPRPLSFELIEIEKKEPGRHTVLAKIEMKNPLAYTSKKVGQDLPDIPERRPERRRYLAVKTGEDWGVKLDLAAAIARVQFVSAFEQKLSARDLDGARAMLEAVPAPPDEANSLRKRDRMKEALTERLAALEAKLAKKAAGAAPYHCFQWVHGKDFGTECELRKSTCERARKRALAEHRDCRECKPVKTAVCYEGVNGLRCFGDQRSCLEASTRVGVILKLCGPR